MRICNPERFGGAGKKRLEEGDWDFVYAARALELYGILPSVYADMSEREKAFIIAAIQDYYERLSKNAKMHTSKLDKPRPKRLNYS